MKALAGRRSPSKPSRGWARHLAKKQYDVAMTYAARTYEMVEEQLKTRQLDDESHLPIALGAAIEVQAHALAAQGRPLGRVDAAATRNRALQGHVDHHDAQQERQLDRPRRPAGVAIIARMARPQSRRPPKSSRASRWCCASGRTGAATARSRGRSSKALVNKYQDSGITVDRADAALRLRREEEAGGAGRRARLHRSRCATSITPG